MFEPKVLQAVQRYLVRNTDYDDATVPIGVIEVFCEFAGAFDDPRDALETLTAQQHNQLIERGHRRRTSHEQQR